MFLTISLEAAAAFISARARLSCRLWCHEFFQSLVMWMDVKTDGHYWATSPQMTIYSTLFHSWQHFLQSRHVKAAAELPLSALAALWHLSLLRDVGWHVRHWGHRGWWWCILRRERRITRLSLMTANTLLTHWHQCFVPHTHLSGIVASVTLLGATLPWTRGTRSHNDVNDVNRTFSCQTREFHQGVVMADQEGIAGLDNHELILRSSKSIATKMSFKNCQIYVEMCSLHKIQNWYLNW